MNSSPNSERSRLARELHDGLAQELASVGYQLDQLVGDPALDNKNRRVIRDIRFSLSGLINQVRDEIFELRHESSKSSNQIITEQAETVLFNSSITLEVNGQIDLDSSSKFEIIRVIRELIINAKRHSNCDLIQIDLMPGKIVIKDNGLGGLTNKDDSYGLTGVKERLELIEAKIDITSELSGTKVEITLSK
jgi:NarL family two-component system sensor histidine kinase LiaS